MVPSHWFWRHFFNLVLLHAIASQDYLYTPRSSATEKCRFVLRSCRNEFISGRCLEEATRGFSDGGGVAATFCECRERP